MFRGRMQKGDNEYTESYADRDIIRVSEVFVLRHIQIPHSRSAKNRPVSSADVYRSI